MQNVSVKSIDAKVHENTDINTFHDFDANIIWLFRVEWGEARPVYLPEDISLFYVLNI